MISPRDVLNKTLLTLNFLNVWEKSKITPAEQHFGNSEKKTKSFEHFQVWYKDEIKGWIPAVLHFLGRGYAFISVNNSRIWVPLRLVKLQDERPNRAPVSGMSMQRTFTFATREASPPTWGQLKKLTQEAEKTLQGS